MKVCKTFLERCYGCHVGRLPWFFIRGCRSDAGMTMQAPGKDFASLLDVSGDFDFFIVGLQEAPNFDSKNSIQQTLGDKYWCDSSPLSITCQDTSFSALYQDSGCGDIRRCLHA